MKRRQFTLLILLILGVVLWLARAWWLPALLTQIPVLEKRADLIQTIDSLFNILAAVVNLVLGYLLWLTHRQQEEQNDKELLPLRATTWPAIRDCSPQGGRLQWIDRNATNANELRAQPRLALIGLSGEGKTREATELIRRAVELDLITEGQVFEPNRDFLNTSAVVTNTILDKVVAPTQHACLLLDDLHSYSTNGLEQLASLLAIFTHPQIDHRYVIATVRSDLVRPDQKTWLAQQSFQLIRLPKIEAKQAEQWLANASQVHDLPLSKKVRQTFIEQNRQGMPGHLLRGLLTIKSTLIEQPPRRIQIKPAVVAAVMNDIDTQERQALYRRAPLAIYLLTALSHFHAAEVRSAQPLVLGYAEALYRDDHTAHKRWQQWWAGRTIQRTLTYLVNFDISVQNGLVAAPDVLIEGAKADHALQQVGDFLITYRWPLHNCLLRRFHRHAETQRWALFDLAMRCQKQNKLTNALYFYNATVRVSPHSWCYNNRGTTYAELGQLSDAIVNFNQAITLNPHDADTFYNRGLAQQAMRRFEDAIADFDQAIAFYSHSKDKAATYNNRGNAHIDFGQPQSTIADFNQAVALDPNYATAIYNRANARADLGQLVDAIADFNQAIALFHHNKERAIAYSNRGLAFKNLGELEYAINDFSQAITLFTEKQDKAVAYNNRGTVYVEQGKFQDAITDFNQAISFNPNYADAYNNRGATRRAIDQPSDSILDFDHAIALNPDDAASFGNRSLALYATGNLAGAINDLIKATQLFTTNNDKALTYEYLGDLYWEDRKEEAAVTAYQQALALGHSHITLLQKVGSIYRELKQWPEAMDIYRQIVKVDRQALYGWVALADIAYHAGGKDIW